MDAVRELGRFDRSGWIGSAGVPACVVVTESDRVVPKERQLALAELARPIGVFRLDAGHEVRITAPARYAAILESACDRILQE